MPQTGTKHIDVIDIVGSPSTDVVAHRLRALAVSGVWAITPIDLPATLPYVPGALISFLDVAIPQWDSSQNVGVSVAAIDAAGQESPAHEVGTVVVPASDPAPEQPSGGTIVPKDF